MVFPNVSQRMSLNSKQNKHGVSRTTCCHREAGTFARQYRYGFFSIGVFRMTKLVPELPEPELSLTITENFVCLWCVVMDPLTDTNDVVLHDQVSYWNTAEILHNLDHRDVVIIIHKQKTIKK